MADNKKRITMWNWTKDINICRKYSMYMSLPVYMYTCFVIFDIYMWLCFAISSTRSCKYISVIQKYNGSSAAYLGGENLRQTG